MSKRKSDNGQTKDVEKKRKITGHWSQGLLSAMEDPELLIQSDDLVTVIKDKYPKAEYHYLVLPKEDIHSLKALTSKHCDLLKHMEDVGTKLASDEKHNNIKFKLGYHAEASMARLHLHVISEDMNSPCLKTKKHWNSFTSKFFLESKDVRTDLEQNGKISLPSKVSCKEYMDLPLKCHKCDVKPKNMPDLKRHLLTHFKK